MTKEEFAKGWTHFCDCINFGKSNLDAKAIRFMNETPAEILQVLDKSKQHYIAIARIIKTEPVTIAEQSTCKSIALKLAGYFSDDNPLFDKGKFLAACGLTE